MYRVIQYTVSCTGYTGVQVLVYDIYEYSTVLVYSLLYSTVLVPRTRYTKYARTVYSYGYNSYTRTGTRKGVSSKGGQNISICYNISIY